MLQFIQYYSSQDFFNVAPDYCLAGETIVVCPNPAKADEARLRFEQAGTPADCVTISKFMKDQIIQLLPASSLENYKGKAELLLFLGAIWKKLSQNPSYKHFTHSFNIFTELRSFTVEVQVIDAVLENYDDDVASLIRVFQQIMDEMEIIDEHGSYNLLTQRLRDGELPPDYKAERKLIFYGFEAMTASQVDLMKALSLRAEIGILVYKEVMENASDLDWVSWLKSDHDITVAGSKMERLSIQKFSFPKNYIFQVLKQNPNYEGIILGTKKSDYNYIQELPGSEIFFKQSIDLFSQSFEKVWLTLDKEGQSSDAFREQLKNLSQEQVKSQRFQELKITLLILNKLNQWEELSDVNNYLGFFDFELLKESSMLDVPRINKTVLNSKGFARPLSEIENINDKNLALVVSSNYAKLSFVEANYTDKVEKYLAAIGPIRRSDFEFNLYLCKLKELLSHNQVDLFVENNMLKSDVSWKKILENFDLNEASLNLSLENSKHYISKDKKDFTLERLSSSRLQTYSDCPQRFYYNYVEKIQPQIELSSQFDAMELGSIQHKVIEVYLNRYDSFDESKLLTVIDEILQKNSSQKSPLDISPIIVEIKAYTFSIIKALIQVKTTLGIGFQFEKEFDLKDQNGISYIGSVDCLGLGDKSNLILDFKRSGYSFTSYKSILEFEKNQLWFYLKRLLDSNVDLLAKDLSLGYIDLSDIKNSMIFTNSAEAESLFKETLEIKRIKRIEDFKEILEKYSEFENEEVARLRIEKDFFPKPMNDKVCDICFLNQTCSRGAIHGDS